MRNGTATHRPFEVTLVEDSRSEAWLILEALKKDHRKLHVTVLTDGDRAADFLHTAAQDRPYPFRTPDLILLDLSIPRKNGLTLLLEIRATPDLRTVPVVVLTTNASAAEISRCYESGANCVLTKPRELERYIDAVRAVEHYWLDVMRPTPAAL